MREESQCRLNRVSNLVPPELVFIALHDVDPACKVLRFKILPKFVQLYSTVKIDEGCTYRKIRNVFEMRLGLFKGHLGSFRVI